ncbi:hypothetical protein SeMB42_g06667 [Synchytrium endobioticum]|uniref:Uncharacterized protein n=1 Tax=Synchytrium endobioticum TaxID=286115 RepID=A0A507CJR7_9FUNG|nr:hypothetical protein SeMB42_g06667 [Synchytrium endobioticum]
MTRPRVADWTGTNGSRVLYTKEGRNRCHLGEWKLLRSGERAGGADQGTEETRQTVAYYTRYASTKSVTSSRQLHQDQRMPSSIRCFRAGETWPRVTHHTQQQGARR